MTDTTMNIQLLDRLWQLEVASRQTVEWRLQLVRTCSLPQYFLLRAVANAEGGVAATDLARELGCSKANAGQLIKRLEKAGWLVTVRDPRDERCLLIELTETGHAKLATCARELVTTAEELFAGLGRDEKEKLLALLEKLEGAAA